jgi:AraC-like DNA-binding protein
MPSASQLAARDLRFGPMLVTELRYDGDNYGQSDPIPAADAILVALQLRPSPKHVVWEDGKQLPIVSLARGMTNIQDLRRSVSAYTLDPFHCVTFSVPLGTSDDSGEASLRDLSLRDPWRFGFEDPVIYALGTALLPALAEPETASRLFVDHVLFALRAHLARRFGVAADGTAHGRGLATWQTRRAKEFIEAHLAENISLADLARECSLSVAHFARSFKRCTGMTPYQFLTKRRIERARDLLLHSGLSLAEVAVCCGFADQSHLTKVFRRVLGRSPGSFRAARARLR